MIEGGCFCGAVRFRIEGTLKGAQACHCSRCRKLFSGASSIYAEIAAGAQFHWVTGQDKLSTYAIAQDWEVLFCSTCGSTVCGTFEGKVHGIALGTVDGDPGVGIEVHTFVGSKAPWDHIGGIAPQFEGAAPT